MDLMNKEGQANCLFCTENHPTQSCPNAKKFTLKERFAKIRDSSKCFKCLKGYHLARECKASINCHTCGGKHYKVLCKDYKPLRVIHNGKISEIDRPIQRLYMLESSLEDAGEMMNHLNRKSQEETSEIDRNQLANDSTDEVELRQPSAETLNEITPDSNADGLSSVSDTDVADTEVSTEEENRVTRSGRKVMKPRRFE